MNTQDHTGESLHLSQRMSGRCRVIRMTGSGVVLDLPDADLKAATLPTSDFPPAVRGLLRRGYRFRAHMALDAARPEDLGLSDFQL